MSRKTEMRKVLEEDTDKVESAVSFNDVAACFIRKRDFIAKQAGIDPEDVVLGAYNLVFVVGKPFKGKVVTGALIVQACAVKGGYEFLQPLVDHEDDN